MRRLHAVLAATLAAIAVMTMAWAFSLGGRTAHAAGPVLKGFDLLETDSSTTYQDLALPAGFFGPGCAAYNGRIQFEGVPFDSYTKPASKGGPTLYTGLAPTDTIVQRQADAGPIFPAKIAVDIVKLSLRSINNIVVACPGGTQVWNTKAEVPEGDTNQVKGSMTIRHEFADCGTFDVTLPVKPTITFTEKSGAGKPAIGPFLFPTTLNFVSNNNIWCDNVSNPLLIPPGDTVVQKPGLTTNFFPGIENIPNKGSVKHVTVEEAANAKHGIQPAERRPALGGVADYPNLTSGGNAGLLFVALAAASILSLGGAGWYVRRRFLS